MYILYVCTEYRCLYRCVLYMYKCIYYMYVQNIDVCIDVYIYMYKCIIL